MDLFQVEFTRSLRCRESLNASDIKDYFATERLAGCVGLKNDDNLNMTDVGLNVIFPPKPGLVQQRGTLFCQAAIYVMHVMQYW